MLSTACAVARYSQWGKVVGMGRLCLVLGACLVAIHPSELRAQDEAGKLASDTLKASDIKYPNTTAGEFTPSKGFDIVETRRASLNISFYGLFRYINQMSPGQLYLDHLGRERVVSARNDLYWHRTMVWLTGFFFTHRFRYNVTMWSLSTTQQALLFGNLQYIFSSKFLVGAGILPNLTVRSMQGTWPFWAGSDRQMSEEFFRGGFSSGVFVSGEVLPKFYYSLSVNTNLSQLGVVAANDTRDFAFSGTFIWMPTTGEFGPRGGLGDFEDHQQLATRFGASGGHSRESRYANDSVPPNATQIKLSDGVNPFDAGALAEGVTVQKLNYDEVAVDVGFKYRGAYLQGEYYFRRLSHFQATGALPITSIFDHGFQVQGSYMVVPRLVNLYLTYGQVFDDFGRRPWEISPGVQVYPSRTRSWRLNVHLIRVERSPASSTFGYYTAGQSGTTLSIGTDFLL
ncbi:MAG TPA: hypothetical protein VFS33_01320 [Gemmatimonadales bacterium]|nr:hypothetical protein [Gemmatimonadales bacterium]